MFSSCKSLFSKSIDKLCERSIYIKGFITLKDLLELKIATQNITEILRQVEYNTEIQNIDRTVQTETFLFIKRSDLTPGRIKKK